jgi:chromosomal replication initiation ATPase DnaA
MAECEICGGRRWVVELDGGAGRARPCGCQAERSLAERLAAAGVWEEYLHCTREAWRGTWPAAQLQGFGSDRHLCTILGPVGSGKTHLATAILGEWLGGGGRGRWWETSTMLAEARQGVAAGSGARLSEKLKSAKHLIVLDDVLSQQGTDWTDALISQVVRYRHGRHLPTVITANVANLVELDRIEPRLGSRCGSGIVIGLVGVDRRTAKGGLAMGSESR